VLPIAASYSLFVLAHHWPKRLTRWVGWVYGSYGLYVWGFPIQQTLIHAGVHDRWTLAALAVPLSYALGQLSWLAIEQPTQRLRTLIPPPPRRPRRAHPAPTEEQTVHIPVIAGDRLN
jgi:peptidoglycan/LPS O-acetylase OafA/YrhL